MQRLSRDQDVGGQGAGARDFVLEDFLPYQLSVAANRISRLFARRYSHAFGISIAQWRVMAVLGRFGTLSPSGIAERTEMDKVKVSRAAARLANSGLLSSEADTGDGRMRRFALTPRGGEIHAAIIAMARTLEAELAQCLPSAEWAVLHQSLRVVSDHAGGIEAREPGAAPDVTEP